MRRAGIPAMRALELDSQPQLRDAPRRLRPVTHGAAQRRQMLLIGEARHRVVGLRIEMRASDAPFGRRGQHRQARLGDEIVDERGDEHRLARARQAGDAEPQRPTAEVVADRARHDAGFESDIVEERHRRPGHCARLYLGAPPRSRKRRARLGSPPLRRPRNSGAAGSAISRRECDGVNGNDQINPLFTIQILNIIRVLFAAPKDLLRKVRNICERTSCGEGIALLNHYCQIVVTFGESIVVAPQQTFALVAGTVSVNGMGPSVSTVWVEFRSRL